MAEITIWRDGVGYDPILDVMEGLQSEHVDLPTSAWEPLPNARKLAAAYNRPFEYSFRLRLQRATDWMAMKEITEPYELAADALHLAEAIRLDPTDMHTALGELAYYPDGATVKGPQVWREGKFWLRVQLNG